MFFNYIGAVKRLQVKNLLKQFISFKKLMKVAEKSRSLRSIIHPPPLPDTLPPVKASWQAKTEGRRKLAALCL